MSKVLFLEQENKRLLEMISRANERLAELERDTIRFKRELDRMKSEDAANAEHKIVQARCSTCGIELLQEPPMCATGSYDGWRAWIESLGWDLADLNYPKCPKCKPSPFRTPDEFIR